MAHTDVQEILGALKDVDFPADKDELLRAAKVGGASGEALKALRGIPPDRYDNRDQVARSVRVDPDSDLGHSAAQRAEQARKGGKPGLSQHLRDAPKPPVEDELDR
ncbi:DUF2795 domain-containing protein [Streptomyces sp. S1A]|uniref:DUF2795 domain-containing protein n=1 Tax=Streptomyces chitinivorans TaxID=1257027 RepID=A0ABW7HLB8_9ACTN|nr:MULTISPECIES: DUF2795 domain-containing protein [Streptomyces]MCG3043416.1 DUF2795 domain-containing protein [Streptomyces sp. ICN903]MDH2408029.1 DUF2795 domain-containing protein [Streptomyces chitinivorans]